MCTNISKIMCKNSFLKKDVCQHSVALKTGKGAPFLCSHLLANVPPGRMLANIPPFNLGGSIDNTPNMTSGRCPDTVQKSTTDTSGR